MVIWERVGLGLELVDCLGDEGCTSGQFVVAILVVVSHVPERNLNWADRLGGEGVGSVFAESVYVGGGESVGVPRCDQGGELDVFERVTCGGVELEDEEFLVNRYGCGKVAFQCIVCWEVGMAERDQVEPVMCWFEGREVVGSGRERVV